MTSRSTTIVEPDHELVIRIEGAREIASWCWTGPPTGALFTATESDASRPRVGRHARVNDTGAVKYTDDHECLMTDTTATVGTDDPDTRLVRFGARDYDAETGRWTNKDPIGFARKQGNQYVYVDGEPVNRRDPDGRILRLAFRAAKWIRLSRRVGIGGALKAMKVAGKEGGVWASSEREAIQFAQKQSTVSGGGGRYVVDPAGFTRDGKPTRAHIHALDAAGNRLPGHIWWGGIGAFIFAILDADGDDEITAFDIVELANPFFWLSANETNDQLRGYGGAI